MEKEAFYKTFLIKKVSSRQNYFAYYLSQYQNYEKLTDSELKGFLDCSDEDFFRLALCRVPKMYTNEFNEKIRAIADSSNVLPIKLIKIIRRVTSLKAMHQAVQETYDDNRLLLAARPKDDSSENTNTEND